MVRIRGNDETGAVTIIVALFITVLFGFVALSVDVARLYEERRQLVNAADLSALSGSQLLWKSKADAEALAQEYVTYNPTTNHPGGYDTANGDLVEAKRLSDGHVGCPVTVSGSTVNVDCVTSKVQSPAFEWLFGSILGFESRSIAATSTAVLGKGAVGGTKVFPFLLRDCPNPAQYPDEVGVSVDGCPYTFSDSFDGVTTAFDEDSENFVGASVPHTKEGQSLVCPLSNGYSAGVPSGNNQYREVMAGIRVPCTIAPGMRIDSRGGAVSGATEFGLTARGANASTCMNEASFNATFAQEDDGDGFVTILDRNNPCLIIISFVTWANPSAPNVTSNVAGTAVAMQKSVAAGRFASVEKTNDLFVVRRNAYYYITSFDGDTPRGVYLRALDPTASLTGAVDKCPTGVSVTQCAHHGVFVVKLID